MQVSCCVGCFQKIFNCTLILLSALLGHPDRMLGRKEYPCASGQGSKWGWAVQASKEAFGIGDGVGEKGLILAIPMATGFSVARDQGG